MQSKSETMEQLPPEIITKLCFDKFRSLPKTGKPKETEWTVLAGVVIHNSRNGSHDVVSLGSGTKCIGKSKLCSKGLILNDSHAEVLARRALLRYFYFHIRKALETNNDIIFECIADGKKCKLKDGLSFHFLSTQTPCGDACIVEKDINFSEEEEPLCKKSKLNNSAIEERSGMVNGDIVYTGAKLLGPNHSDLIEQIVGAVRTKPGRGERTLSMSCSDKLAKWQVMGVQGALLDVLLESPIYFETLNFCQSDCGALERAIWKRFSNHDYKNDKYYMHKPQIQVCNMEEFPHNQNESRQPSPNGLVWCNIPDAFKPYEISVNGKRQGVTSKKSNTTQAALAAAKFNLFKIFLETVKLKPDLLNTATNLEVMTYLEAKLLSVDYQIAWNELKRKYFKQWSAKPEDVLKFTVGDVEALENKKVVK